MTAMWGGAATSSESAPTLWSGVSTVDITPDPGGHLAGYAARVAPSAGVHDPLEAIAAQALELREALGEPGLLAAGYSGGVPGYVAYPPEEYAGGGRTGAGQGDEA